nr:hypothetical protein GCM10020093_047060 [Planobispora longispora]
MTPRVSSCAGTKTSMTTVRSPSRATGRSRRYPLSVSAVTARLSRETAATVWTGARAVPTVPPPGRCRAMRSCAPVLARACGSRSGFTVIARTGTSADACRSASVMALAVAPSLTKIPRGTRKARAIIDAPASASRARVRLTAAPPA